MRNFYFIPLAIFVGMMTSCNSGADQSAEATKDSVVASAPSMTDTSHSNMTMETVEPVPDIPAGAKVYFKNLKNGQTVSSPLKVEMVAVGINVDTIGPIKASSGHHHILIDAGDSIVAGSVVPKDSTHLHFGNAQKKAEIVLSPGKHVLTLQFADGIHRSYGGKLAHSVTVNVK